MTARSRIVVIGADGIYSMVREVQPGPALPRCTGYVANRSIFPVSRPGAMAVDDLSRWWSGDAHGDRHVVVRFLDRRREAIHFVTGVPEPARAPVLSHEDRASRIQKESREHKWPRNPMDPTWCFGYDAPTTALGTVSRTGARTRPRSRRAASSRASFRHPVP